MVLESQRFERARVLLSEPASVFSGALRSVLRGMGFRHVFQFETVAALRAEFAATGFDLWITNAEMPDGPVLDLVHDIRHSRIGRDIFIPVVVQSLDVTQALAAQTLNAGADLLWRLPTTGGQITDGIDMLVNRRRPFVVTCDYIGPDRRSKPREGRQIPLIPVPNPLRGKNDDPAIDAEAVMRAISQQKVEAQAFQIGWLIDRIAPLMQDNPASEQAKQYLKRLHTMALELMGRVGVTKYVHQAELCKAVMVQARNVIDEASPKNLDLLKELVQALRSAFEMLDPGQAEAALANALQVKRQPR